MMGWCLGCEAPTHNTHCDSCLAIFRGIQDRQDPVVRVFKWPDGTRIEYRRSGAVTQQAAQS